MVSSNLNNSQLKFQQNTANKQIDKSINPLTGKPMTPDEMKQAELTVSAFNNAPTNNPYGLSSIDPTAYTPDLSGINTLQESLKSIGSNIPTIGTTAPTTGSPTYDLANDPYAKAALENLDVTQKRSLDQYAESLRNLGLSGTGTVGQMTQDFLTSQAREKALLGGELAQGAQAQELQKAQITGFLGNNPTLAREQAAVNSAIQKSGVDLSKFNAGLATEQEKANLLQNAAQLGLNQQQVKAQIDLANATFNENIRQYDQAWNQALATQNKNDMANNILQTISGSLSKMGEDSANRIGKALMTGDTSSLGSWEKEAADNILNKINSAPAEYREALLAAAQQGLTAAWQSTSPDTNSGLNAFLSPIATAVGTAIGGPIGGAFGAALGS